jgi:hypothetical protein
MRSKKEFRKTDKTISKLCLCDGYVEEIWVIKLFSTIKFFRFVQVLQVSPAKISFTTRRKDFPGVGKVSPDI